ncbi:HEAT repeat domain-containing protein [Natronospora cellulosivora (SeqCode)]
MLNYLENSIIIITIATLTLLLTILLYHSILYWQEKLYISKKEKWGPVFLQYLNEEIDLDKAADILNCDFSFLYKLFLGYLSNHNKVDRKDLYRLRALASKIGILDYYIKRLNSMSKKRRLRAISFLAKIEEVSVLNIYQKNLNDKDERIMLASCRAIARIGEHSLFVPVLRNLFNRTNMTFEGISDIMIIFGKGVSKDIQLLLEDYIDGKKDLAALFAVEEFVSLSLLIDILGYFKYKPAVKILEELLRREDNNEVIIHIFKALKKIGEVIAEDLHDYILNEDWVIRSQAVGYISTIRDSRYKEELESLLSDEHWWVRYYAAQALYEIGEKDLLIKITSASVFASDITRYVLAQNKEYVEDLSVEDLSVENLEGSLS